LRPAKYDSDTDTDSDPDPDTGKQILAASDLPTVSIELTASNA
jgi:hypothetical protein